MALIHATSSNYEDLISSGKPVLVDFWAPWCGPCQMIGKILEEIVPLYEGKIDILKVNVDENQDLAARYGVMSIPTLLLFKDNELVKKSVGAVPKKQLEELLNEVLN
jgi:thioredoxin